MYVWIGLDATTPVKVSRTAEKVPTPFEKVLTTPQKVPTMPKNVEPQGELVSGNRLHLGNRHIEGIQKPSNSSGLDACKALKTGFSCQGENMSERL